MSQKRTRVIEAATALFARYGLRKTTVAEIARAAGIGKGTVYLLFENKEALFSAIVRREGEELMRRLRAAVATEETAEGKLRRFILARFEHLEALMNLHQVTAEVLDELRPEVEAARSEHLLAERHFVRDILEAGVQTGELMLEDVGLAALTITATLETLSTPWSHSGHRLCLSSKVDALVDLFVYGMKRRRRAGIGPEGS